VNDADESLAEGFLFSSYRVDKVLGRGGFAFTYLVTRTDGDVYVLKELFPQNLLERNSDGSVRLCKNNQQEQQLWKNTVNGFIDETKALKEINISSIPKLIDCFQANNTYYMVQEFIEGETLEDLIPRFNQLEKGSKNRYAKELLISLLDTLHMLHEYGVLHRDIKSSNIIIRDSNEEPVLIDFGGVRFQVGGVTYNFDRRVWSPGFSSPEQLNDKGEEQHYSSDLYSLAATFYHTLFGVVAQDSIERILNDDVYSFSQHSLTYDKNLLQSLDKAFLLNRKKRYQSASEWLFDIESEQIPNHLNNQLDDFEFSDSFTHHNHFKQASDELKTLSFIIGRDIFNADVAPSEVNQDMSRCHLEIVFSWMDDPEYEPLYYFYDLSSNGTTLVQNNTAEVIEMLKIKASELKLYKNSYLSLAGTSISLSLIMKVFDKLLQKKTRHIR
jgi:serine/threonine protein kinase